MMFNLTDVVKNLLIINVIVYVAVHFLFNQSLSPYFIYFPYDGDSFQPIQIITHMFNHGNEPHLFFNMLTLFFFGPNVESMWGPKKFLFFYFACGLGSLFLHVVLSGSAAVGASGAISGVMVAFAYLFPEARLFPIPIKVKYAVPLLLAYDLHLALAGKQIGVAHYAHIGGALTAVLLIYLFRKNPNFMR